jgi:5-methyltetrahydrofolate--homocysteine methyltransferase
MKEKFAKQLIEYEKFWNREKLSRPILNISAPTGEPYRKHESLEEKWLDENYVVNAALHKHQNSYYTAEGVAFLFTNFGPGCLAACIGGNYVLSEKSIWFDRKPIIDDWENPPELKFDTNSDMWKHLERVQSKAFEHPEINTSITDLGGILDIICSLRGTENMLYDLYDYPDEVKECTKLVTKLWFEAFDLQKEAVEKAGQLYNNWLNVPSSKPWYPLQCDFSYMISPKQFEEFVLPHLVEQVNHMERSVYHLDGVGEIPHIDMLLDIEGLTAIQWVAGAGQPPLYDECWFPLYKKIQDKGKNIILNSGLSMLNVEGSERLIKTLDPTGVYISYTAGDKDRADRMLECVEKWTK